MDQVNVMTVETARKILSVVDWGLRSGLSEPIPGQMCVEAAVCYALGLPHSDDSKCVDPALREFVIALDGSSWSSPTARATGMRKLAVAQLGSLGTLDSTKFVQKLAEQTIRRLLPPMLRQVGLNDAADRCEKEGTEVAAYAARDAAVGAARVAADLAANAADTAYAASAACLTARAACLTAYAANAAANAADKAAYDARYAVAGAAYAARYATNARDAVLTLMCDICIDILRDMRAPGIALMDQVC